MKKTLLTACMLLVACFSFAQFQKGNKVLGFGLGISSSKSENQNSLVSQQGRNSSFSGTVELGFATKANRLHGFFAGAAASQNTNESGPPVNSLSKSQTQSFDAGYFTRFYKSMGKNFYLFGDVRGSYSYSENKNFNQQGASSVENLQKRHAVTVSAFPGVAYKLNNRFLLEVRTGDIVSIGYGRAITTTRGISERLVSSNFSLNSSLGLGFLNNIGIGARWIIGQSKKS